MKPTHAVDWVDTNDSEITMANRQRTKGTSLAKGPVGLIGLALLAYGITAVIIGGHSFAQHAPTGAVHGKSWLGLEVNGWSGLLFTIAGLLLLIAATPALKCQSYGTDRWARARRGHLDRARHRPRRARYLCCQPSDRARMGRGRRAADRSVAAAARWRQD